MINVCIISDSDADYSEDAIKRVKEAIETENKNRDILFAELFEKHLEQSRIYPQISIMNTTILVKNRLNMNI